MLPASSYLEKEGTYANTDRRVQLGRADYPLVLNTGRLLQHWHTGSITRRFYALDAIAPQTEVYVYSKYAADRRLHGFREAAANVLTIDEIDPYGKIPEFKFCAVQIEPLGVPQRSEP